MLHIEVPPFKWEKQANKTPRGHESISSKWNTSSSSELCFHEIFLMQVRWGKDGLVLFLPKRLMFNCSLKLDKAPGRYKSKHLHSLNKRLWMLCCVLLFCQACGFKCKVHVSKITFIFEMKLTFECCYFEKKIHTRNFGDGTRLGVVVGTSWNVSPITIWNMKPEFLKTPQAIILVLLWKYTLKVTKKDTIQSP